MSATVNDKPQLQFRHWVMIAGFWALVTLANALQDWLTLRKDMDVAVLFAASVWLPWAFLTPLIAWIASHFPLERNTWRRAIAVHLAGCAAIFVLLGLLSYWVMPPQYLRPPPAGSERFRPSADEPSPPVIIPSIGEVIIRRTIFQFPIYWAIVGVAQSFAFYERARERERHAAVLESRLSKARLHGLQMQLNPHFLFNTLNSIASLIHQNPHVADEMVASLSEFLRMTLKTSDRAEVALRDELAYLDHYLNIEQIRFGNRLKVERQIDPATLDLLVPVLILQPLVENAIRHGIEKQLAPGVVRIIAARSEDSLCLQVADNGRGLQQDSKKDFKEGVGLTNTRARLNELAGTPASLEVRESPAGGVVAEIRLPCRSQPVT